MEKLLKRKFNVLEIVLIFGPIIDILTSVIQRSFSIDLSIGLIVRGLLLAFLTLYTLFISKYKNKKTSIIYLVCVGVYFVIFIVNTYINKGIDNLFFEVKELIKAFYFPICIVTILNYIETKNYSISPKLIFFIIMEYITLLFIPAVFNIGFESYAQDKIGTIGWYFSGNEISAIFAILFVFVIFSYNFIKNKALYIGVVLYSLFTIMQIGTKIPAIAAVVVILAFIIAKFVQVIVNKNKIDKKLVLSSCSMIVIFAIVFATSPILKNHDIYKNYLISTREEAVLVSTEPTQEKNIEMANTQEQTKENIQVQEPIEETIELQENTNKEETALTSEELATIIHSGRMETQSKINEKFKDTSIIDKIIGMGKLDTKDNSQNLCEIDYLDIFYNFGILGFLLYFAPIIFVIISILKRFSLKEILLNDNMLSFGISLVISFLLCAIAGHTFVAPAVSIFVAVTLLQMNTELKERKNI